VIILNIIGETSLSVARLQALIIILVHRYIYKMHIIKYDKYIKSN